MHRLVCRVAFAARALLAQRSARPSSGLAPAWAVALALTLPALATAGADDPARMPQDQALQRALEGVWCNSNDGGRTCWAHDVFRPDGTLVACGQAEGDSRPFRGTGVVEVVGRRLCYRVSSASDNFWLRPGQRYCTEITAIDRDTHRYRDLDTGAEFTLHRRPAGSPDCPAAR